MAHPYPPHRDGLPYAGKQRYFLTFCTHQRCQLFGSEPNVALVRTQILRAADEEKFEITAYCFMPDHVHLVATGKQESCDAKRFIKRAKQYSGYYFKQENGAQLWQRYGFERVIRDDAELVFTVGYVIRNPVRAGLVDDPAEYPYLGSERYSIGELLEITEASSRD